MKKFEELNKIKEGANSKNEFHQFFLNIVFSLNFLLP